VAWTPTLPAEPPTVPGWWTELSFNRWVAGVAAEIRDREELAEQAKRQRRLRRRVERIDEQILLALSRDEARRHLRRHGVPYESRSARPEEVEHFTRTGRILSVR
jgi:hypothetical protein